MEKTLPLYLGPSVIGSVVCTSDNLRTTLFARTYATLPGICRAYVKGNEGSLLIGVLAPENIGFSAQKTISSAALESSGLTFDEITYAYAVRAEGNNLPYNENWQKLDSFSEILRRDNAVYALAKSSGALSDNTTEPHRLAIPLFTGNPFPRPDILCLLTPQNIGGAIYGIIGISETGAPIKI